jgi:predicted dehydrogenase
MQSTRKNSVSRRDFLKNTGRVAAATTLVASMVPHVHAAENNTIQLALIGCGGRGSGAATQALSVRSGPIRLVAMADVFEERLASSLSQLKKQHGDAVQVPKQRQFFGFDAYKSAMDCLRPGDVAILATPPAFRWVHFTYAIRKNLNVFMEKPLTVDAPTTRRMLKLGEESRQKNLKVGVGLMLRHAKDHVALANRLHSGDLGQIVTLRAYRMHGPLGFFQSDRKPEGISELLYQVQRFHSFLWASGGCFSDFYIHQIDECCWMKGAWPVEANALGGRHYRGNSIDQNLDNYSVEYTFGDGTKFFMFGRTMPGCYEQFASYAHGTKGMAVLSSGGHSTDKAQIFSQQLPQRKALAWKNSSNCDCYQEEWIALIDAIRNDKPYNEVERGAEASLVTSMGRMSAHTGRVVTWDEMRRHDYEFAPDLDKLNMSSQAPLPASADGRYPVPQPGIVTNREYSW